MDKIKLKTDLVNAVKELSAQVTALQTKLGI